MNITETGSYRYIDDFDNSCSAYEKSIELDPQLALARLNYALTLFNNDEIERSRTQVSRVIPY